MLKVQEIFLNPGRTEILLFPGKIKFEVWGAEGGTAAGQTDGNLTPGYGGFSNGTLKLHSTIKAFVYVGGKGNSNGEGGFNGGGNTTNPTNCASGGGGSDIRLQYDDLHARVIVAGGGGGLEHSYSGSIAGYGGGAEGGDGFQLNYENSGGGGKQDQPGTHKGTGTKPGFGYGGSSSISNTGAGGGGWYGGGASHADQGEGGGGSGYVFTQETLQYYPDPLISDIFFLHNAFSIPGNEPFLSPSGIDEKGHKGDGAVKITYISFLSHETCQKQFNIKFNLYVSIFIQIS